MGELAAGRAGLVGQTPGMRFLGIRLQSQGSSQIGFRRALKRAIAAPIAAIPAGLGFWMILVSPRRRSLLDVFADTEVIYDDASAPWSAAPREWAGPARKHAELAGDPPAHP